MHAFCRLQEVHSRHLNEAGTSLYQWLMYLDIPQNDVGSELGLYLGWLVPTARSRCVLNQTTHCHRQAEL